MTQPAAVETEVKPVEVKTADPVEGVKEETKEQPKETADSKRFAELSKGQAKAFKMKKELEAERKAFEESKKRLIEEERAKVKQELAQLFKQKPKDAFRELSTNYDEVTTSYLSDGKITPEILKAEVDSKIEELQKTIEDQKRALEEKERSKVLEEYDAGIINALEKNKEKYPAAYSLENGGKIISQMIQQRFYETQKEGEAHLMTFDEAADILEKDLDSYIQRALQNPKYQAARTPTKEESKQPSPNKPKTITNELTSTAPSMLPARTENDRIKRALEKLSV